MKNCVFCNIAKGKNDQTFRIIYSDDLYIAMLVSHPETRGHFIVFPKKHYSEILEMNQVDDLFKMSIRLSEKFTKKLDAKSYTLKLNNNLYKIDDDLSHVGHTHIHTIPRYATSDKNNNPKKATKDRLKKIKKGLIK